MHRERSSARIRTLIFFVCTLTLVGSCPAFEYTWAPQARAMMRLDDNVRGRANNQHGALGFDVGAGVALAARSETITSILTPRFNVRRFAIGDNLDAEEWFVDFENEWLQETFAPRLDFSYSRESTLARDLTDAGLVDDIKDRDTISVHPSVDWLISDRWIANAGFFYSDVTYLDAGQSGLVDYDYMQGTTGVTYIWDDTLQLFSNFFVSEFETPDTRGKTRTYGVQAGATKQWDATLSISAALGYTHSDIEFTSLQQALVFDPFPRLVSVLRDEQVSDSGAIANVSVKKDFEKLKTEFNYIRQVSPTGRGAQSTSDDIEGRLRRRLNERLELRLIGLHQIRATEGERITTVLDRDITRLQGVLSYRLHPEWRVDFSYRFVHREYTRGQIRKSISADSNTILVTLRYNGAERGFDQGLW